MATDQPLTDIGSQWNEFVIEMQRKPFNLLSAMMPKFNPACCGKRKGPGAWATPWSVTSFPSDSSLGESALRHKSSRDNSENEMPVFNVSAVTIVPEKGEIEEMSTPKQRGVCGECGKPLSKKRAVYLAYDVHFCSEMCRNLGMDKYS